MPHQIKPIAVETNAMNALPTIRVMLSSRSRSSAFADPAIPLETLRRNLQALLHGLRWAHPSVKGALPLFCEQPIFEVWIHENERAKSTARNTFELSLEEVREADIILVLYTGEAGSAASDEQIGICHAELQDAVAKRGDVVHVIELIPLANSHKSRDQRFRAYVDSLSAFRLKASNEAELQASVVQLLHKAVANLVRRAASGGRRRDRGSALDWGRLDLAERRRSICTALAAELGIDAVESVGAIAQVVLADRKLSVRIDAIPDVLSVAAARELVGQPFHRDHLLTDSLSADAPGIVHIIACHRGVTETQAKKMLGTSDAMAIASDFGVYAADHVQQIQLFFLTQCADAGAVGIAVRRIHEWLAQAGEIERVVNRALGRKMILQAVQQAREVTRLAPAMATRKRVPPARKST